MNEVNNISLEQAAKLYAKMLYPTCGGVHYESCHQDFTAGAQWLKDQLKHKLEIANNALIAFHLRHPHEPQLLASYTNEEIVTLIQNMWIDLYVTIDTKDGSQLPLNP